MWDLGIGEGGIDCCVTKGEEVPTCFETNWSTNGENMARWPWICAEWHSFNKGLLVRWRARLVAPRCNSSITASPQQAGNQQQLRAFEGFVRCGRRSF